MKELDVVTSIRKLALHNINCKVTDEESLLEYLKRWWCIHYNRPYKDPLLFEYTFEELLLEYFEILYTKNKDDREKAELEFHLLETGQTEEEDDEAWFKEQMGDDYISPEELMEAFKGDNTSTSD